MILTVRELPFCLSYHLFGSLMPAQHNGSNSKHSINDSTNSDIQHDEIAQWAIMETLY
jgi:hypothetical protein